MLISFIIAILILFKCTEVLKMLVRLYASEIILERITIDDVPAKLRDKVREYLEALGYEI